MLYKELAMIFEFHWALLTKIADHNTFVYHWNLALTIDSFYKQSVGKGDLNKPRGILDSGVAKECSACQILIKIVIEDFNILTIHKALMINHRNKFRNRQVS